MNKIKSEAILVFEVLGRPAEHIVEALKQVSEAISKEPGIKIIDSKVYEPKTVENKDKEGKIIESTKENELFSSFSEVELEAEDLFNIIGVIFKYMPAHVELLSPERVELSNIDFNSLFNQLLVKLHNYDSIAKSALMTNQMLAAKLNALMPKNNAPAAKSVPLEISLGKSDKEEKSDKKEKGIKKVRKAKKK